MMRQAFILALASAVVVLGAPAVMITGTTMQEFLGAGGALTHSTAYLLQNAANQDAADEVIRRLFGLPEGCTVDSNASYCMGAGLSVIRLPIGTSDFGVTDFYSFDDMPVGEDDWDLEHFSTRRDEAYFIPALQRILSEANRAGREVTLIAAPWSAPGWMKNTGTMLGGELRTDARIIPTYARYLLRYIDAYRARYGIHIDALSIQNEPWNTNPSYPTMRLYPAQEAALVQEVDKLLTEYEDALGIPANQSTKIWLWDHNWHVWYPQEVFNNLTTSNNFPARAVGTAFHCYAGTVGVQSQVRAIAPAGHQRVFFTECSGGTWSPNFDSDLTWDVQTLVAGNTQNWGETVLKWNLVLDSQGGPKVEGGCMTCRGIVTLSLNNLTSTTVWNEDYLSLSHIGSFVERGDTALEVIDAANRTTAFRKRRDGRIVVITTNPSPNMTTTFKFCTVVDTLCGTVSLPPYSAATLSLPASAAACGGRCEADWWLTVAADPSTWLRRQVPVPLN